MNWIKAGAVGPVKNQADCGASWAFAATGALEGVHKITSGKLESFSEQQQIDCNELNLGCSGGDTQKAFFYWEKSKAQLESAYPF